MNEELSKTKITDAELEVICDQLVKGVVDAMNKAAQEGLSLCQITRSLGIIMFWVNTRTLGSLSEALDHVEGHLAEVYEEIKERGEQIIHDHHEGDKLRMH